MMRASSVAEATARAGGRRHRQTPARSPLSKAPGVAEAVRLGGGGDVAQQGRRRAPGPDAFKRSIGRRALKDEEDLAFISGRLDALIAEGGRGECRAASATRHQRPLLSFVALPARQRFSGCARGRPPHSWRQSSCFGPATTPEDIRQAGLATLAPPPERRAAYDMLFRIHFLGGDEVSGRRGRRGGNRTSAGKRGTRVTRSHCSRTEANKSGENGGARPKH